MKKVILILSLLLLGAPVFAQYFRYTGYRYIKLTDDCWEFMTIDESFKPKKQVGFKVAFQVYNNINESNLDKKFKYFIILKFNGVEIPCGGKLLIKTGKDEVISSICVKNQLPSVDLIPIYKSDTGGEGYESHGHYCGRYELTPESIAKIAADGVIKIRVATNGESINIDLPHEEMIKVEKEKKKANKFGHLVSQLLQCSDILFNHPKYF
jgi:hypothetical protein